MSVFCLRRISVSGIFRSLLFGRHPWRRARKSLCACLSGTQVYGGGVGREKEGGHKASPLRSECELPSSAVSLDCSCAGTETWGVGVVVGWGGRWGALGSRSKPGCPGGLSHREQLLLSGSEQLLRQDGSWGAARPLQGDQSPWPVSQPHPHPTPVTASCLPPPPSCHL